MFVSDQAGSEQRGRDGQLGLWCFILLLSTAEEHTQPTHSNRSD